MTVPGDHVLVMGAGRSPLVAELAASGRGVSVIDISAVAVDRLLSDVEASGRTVSLAPDPAALEGAAGTVTGLVADAGDLPALPRVTAWHDRAVFHFITDAERQRQYFRSAAASIIPNGHLVLAEFATDGPPQCSGLDVARHGEDDLVRLAGQQFSLRACERRGHETPWGASQSFMHVMFERTGD